jgi:hypothetical protein
MVAQDCYKRVCDRRVRPKNSSLLEGSLVYVRREVHKPNVNPKLDQQVDGPYEVVCNHEHTLLLRMEDNFIRVSSDRVTPAPEQIGLFRGNDCLPPDPDLSKTRSWAVFTDFGQSQWRPKSTDELSKFSYRHYWLSNLSHYISAVMVEWLKLTMHSRKNV